MKTEKLRFIGLFEGIGGFSVAAQKAGFEIVALCEIDKFCKFILKNHYPNVPIHDNIFELDGKQFFQSVDVVSGGFPCQPFSTAGKRLGSDDERFLFPETLRFLSESKPAWFIGENVLGITTLSESENPHTLENETNTFEEKYYVLPKIIESLEQIGYKVQIFSIGSVSIGFNNIRQRIWILANLSSERCQKNDFQTDLTFKRQKQAADKRIQRHFAGLFRSELFEISESDVHGENVGISSRSFEFACTKALGNAINPNIALIFFEYIQLIENLKIQQYATSHN